MCLSVLWRKGRKDYHVQCQDHSETSKCQWNLVWWHKLDCLLKRLHCFVMYIVLLWTRSSQGHSNNSEFQRMFIWMISSQLRNLCNQTWYYYAASWARVSGKDLFAIFKVKVTVKAFIMNYVSTIFTKLLIFLQPNLMGTCKFLFNQIQTLCDYQMHWIRNVMHVIILTCIKLMLIAPLQELWFWYFLWACLS